MNTYLIKMTTITTCKIYSTDKLSDAKIETFISKYNIKPVYSDGIDLNSIDTEKIVKINSIVRI